MCRPADFPPYDDDGAHPPCSAPGCDDPATDSAGRCAAHLEAPRG